FDLSCDKGHRFEAWFGSSGDFAGQSARGLVTCPQCGSGAVGKAPMAPAVARKGNRQPDPAVVPRRPMASGPPPPQVVAALEKLAEAQASALRASKWVGDAFAEQSR